MKLKYFKIFTITLAIIGFTLNSDAQKLTYSESFTQGTAPSGQCTRWNTFRATLLAKYSYQKLRFYSTANTTGYTLTDTAAIKNLANALRTGSVYTVTVGGTRYDVGTGCGNGCNGVTAIEFSANNGGNCWCGAGASLRPGLTQNANWGGFNGRNCNAPSQRMTLEFEYLVAPDDVGVANVSALSKCDATQDIVATFRNFGINRLDSAIIHWTFNGVSQPDIKYNSPYLISDTLATFEDSVIVLKAAQSFVAHTDYEIKAWASMPNGNVDTVPENDTAIYAFRFLGIPGAVTAGPVSKCGIGQVPLSATVSSAGDSIAWFFDSIGGNHFDIRENSFTPFLYDDDTVYAQAYRMSKSDTFSNGFPGNTVGSNNLLDVEGGMIDVEANGGDVFITHMIINLQSNSPFDYRLFVKDSTHIGYQNNKFVWTMVDSGTLNIDTAGGRNYGTLPLNLTIVDGESKAVYVEVTKNNLMFSGGTVGIENDEVISSSGKYALIGAFGNNSTNRDWTFNHAFIANSPSCPNSSPRVAVPIDIKPTPIGASLQENTTFEGTFNAGTMADPDVVAEGDEIIYELIPPTGYVNADHGLNPGWAVTGITLETENGTMIYTGDTSVTAPSASTNGLLSYIPHDDFTDSTLKLSIRINDIGNNNCDTTIERYIVIAPRARPDFVVPTALCANEYISFINASSVSTGNMTFKWYFGNGDSSTSPNTSILYAAPGTYNVTLQVKTVPYGYITDTTIAVTVLEFPQADFIRTNACEGFDVVFDNTTVYNGTATVDYTWDFGDPANSTSTTKDEQFTYADQGAYTVKLKAQAGGCFTEKSKTVYQFAKPVVDFTAPTGSVCNHAVIDFPNSSTISVGNMGASWDFGNGTFDNSINGEGTYDVSGNYNVQLTMISEFDCRDSMTKAISIKEGGDAAFSYTNSCVANPTSFTFTGDAPSSQNATLQWDFNGEGVSGALNPNHTWAGTGSKAVKLLVLLQNGCHDSTTMNIQIEEQPDVDFDFQGLCEGDAVEFINKTTVTSGLMKHSWDFGDLNGSTDSDPSHTYASKGTYDVTLRVGLQEGCSDSLTKQLVIMDLPVCNFTIKDKWVNGHRGYDFTPSIAGYPFHRWTFGEGGSSQDANAFYQYINDGTFEVTLFARDANGCECESTQTLEVSQTNTIGIEEETLLGVSVYPNPTTGRLTIDLPTIGSVYSIEVMNVIGKTILSDDFTNVSGKSQIDLSAYSKGMYLIKITENNKSKTVKVNLMK